MMLEKKQNGNWKKYAYLYNKNKNIDFLCSCGKIYTSYPALYLHCQRKHGKKISAELVKQECTIAVLGKTATYRYVLTEENKQKEKQPVLVVSLMEEISAIMNAYNSEKAEMETKSSPTFTRYPIHLWRIKVLRKYMEFLAEELSQFKVQDLEDIIYSIPYFFNSFALGQQKEVEDVAQYRVYCDILYGFGDWLKQKQYTGLTTVLIKEETEEGSSAN